MKENMNKAMYVAPVVEIMNARVEKGFAGSGDIDLNTELEHIHNQNNNTATSADFD